MSKWFVGQRVRLVSTNLPENYGAEGRILDIGQWDDGDELPNGKMYSGDYCDLFIAWDRPVISTVKCQVLGESACRSNRVEPILYDGAQPIAESFEEMMGKLREGVVA